MRIIRAIAWRSVAVYLHPEVFTTDHLTGFLTCFPFFDVFPSVLKPTVTIVIKVDKTHSSGSCTGFAPVSLTDSDTASSSSKHRGKNTKNIQLSSVYNFLKIQDSM